MIMCNSVDFRKTHATVENDVCGLFCLRLSTYHLVIPLRITKRATVLEWSSWPSTLVGNDQELAHYHAFLVCLRGC